MLVFFVISLIQVSTSLKFDTSTIFELKFGLFKSLKPITVNFLANRMIQEVLSTDINILTYKLEDILVH